MNIGGIKIQEKIIEEICSSFITNKELEKNPNISEEYFNVREDITEEYKEKVKKRDKTQRNYIIAGVIIVVLGITIMSVISYIYMNKGGK